MAVPFRMIEAVLRDYARFGLLLAHDGHWRTADHPCSLDRGSDACAPDQPQPQASNGYGYQVWISPGERRMFALCDLRGQAIYVDPASRLIMVHTAVRKQARDPVIREANALWRSLVQQLGH